MITVAPGPYGRGFLQVQVPLQITIIPHAPGTKNQSRWLWTFSLPGIIARVNGKNWVGLGWDGQPPFERDAAGWYW
jgi:hypothetical protein